MTWRTILAVGAVASAAAVGCTVTAKVEGGDGGDAGPGAGGKAETGGSGGASGSGGTKTTGGSSGKAGSGGMKATDSGINDAHFDVCNPDKSLMCDNCVQTKCCPEWLDCVNDTDCYRTVGGKQGEFACIQECIQGDGSTFMTAKMCAGPCQHGTGTVSPATSSLIACMRDTGDSGTGQNCTQECFGRPL